MKVLLTLATVLSLVGCIATPGDEDEPDDDDRSPGSTPATPTDDCPAATAPVDMAPPVGQSQAVASNDGGTFTYSGQVSVYTHMDSAIWENVRSTKASVDWAGQSSTGSFVLTIQDACGKEVYREEYSSGQGATHEETLEGEPGGWVIVMDFKVYTGQMALSITGA